MNCKHCSALRWHPNKGFYCTVPDCKPYTSKYDVMELYERVYNPKPYDVEKVIEQIKEEIRFYKELANTDDEEDKLAMNCIVNGLYRALEKVRKGGDSDETCKG